MLLNGSHDVLGSEVFGCLMVCSNWEEIDRYCQLGCVAGFRAQCVLKRPVILMLIMCEDLYPATRTPLSPFTRMFSLPRCAQPIIGYQEANRG